MPGGRDLRIPTSAKGGPRSLEEWRATHTHTHTANKIDFVNVLLDAALFNLTGEDTLALA